MAAPHRKWVVVVGVFAALSIAIPVMGADPSPSAGPSEPVAPATSAVAGQSAPPEESSPESEETSPQNAAPSTDPQEVSKPPSTENAPNAGKAPKAPKAPKGPKALKADKAAGVPVTVTGTVAQTTDGKGRPSFTITDGSTTWQLSAGPPWFWGDKNPLAAYVGKSVTVAGSAEQGGSDLDVETVDGTAIRAAGKPPWAGGPWVVGSTHPGWKPWMADGKPGKGHGAGHAAQKKPKPSPGS